MQNTLKITQGILAFLIVIAGLTLALWKCQYGIDMYDEPYYLAAGFRLIAEGDLPFRHEVWNGPRHHDILNHFLVRPFIPFDLLTLRQSAVIFYALILLTLSLLCFRKRFGILAALLFFTCIAFDPLPVHTWSYNTWVRNLVGLQAIFLILGHYAKNQYIKDFLFLIAGILFGAAILSYNTLLAAFGISLLILSVASYYWKIKNGTAFPKRLLLLYSFGVLISLTLDASYIASNHLFNDWIYAFQTSRNTRYYSGSSFLNKVPLILSYLASRPEFWLVLVSFFWARKTPRWLSFSLAAITVIHFTYKVLKSAPHATGWVLGSLIALGGAATLVLFHDSWKKREPVLLLLTLTAVFSGLGMALTSNGGHTYVFWAVPTLVIPLIALLTKSPIVLTKPLLATLLFCMAIATTYRAVTTSYGDAPPSQATHKLNIPRLTGIHTTALRAQILTNLYNEVKDSRFVLAYDHLPITFFFGPRHSINTVIIEKVFTALYYKQALRQMVTENRIPEKIIRNKSGLWDWGLPTSFDLGYEPDYSLNRFTRCTATLSKEYPDFNVYSVDAAKVSQCVEGLSEDHLALQ